MKILIFISQREVTNYTQLPPWYVISCCVMTTAFNSNWTDKGITTWDGLYVTLDVKKYFIVYDLIFNFIYISAIFIKTNNYTLSSSKWAYRIVMSFILTYI
jgi:hypothetical protein